MNRGVLDEQTSRSGNTNLRVKINNVYNLSVNHRSITDSIHASDYYFTK